MGHLFVIHGNHMSTMHIHPWEPCMHHSFLHSTIGNTTLLGIFSKIIFVWALWAYILCGLQVHTPCSYPNSKETLKTFPPHHTPPRALILIALLRKRLPFKGRLTEVPQVTWLRAYM